MDDPYRTAIEERIRELQRYRKWITSHLPAYRWNDLRDHYRDEAGALNRVRNQARKAQAAKLAQDLADIDQMFRGDHYAGMGR